MSNTLRSRIHDALRDARARTRSIGESRIPEPPLLAVQAVLVEEAARRFGAVALHQAAELAREGASAVLEEDVSLDEIDELVTCAITRASTISPDEPIQGLELSGLLALEVIIALRRMWLLWRDQAAAIFMQINMLDDVIACRAKANYFLRPAILQGLYYGFRAVSKAVRHTDLVVSLKWALSAIHLDNQGFFDVGLEALRELPERIDQRIRETHDGLGFGPTPSGRPLDPRRVAGREVVGPSGRLVVETYRSLPLLKAEALFELGRELAETRFGASEDMLEEAHRALDQASISFFAAGAQALAGIAAVLAAECLDRLIELSADQETRRARLARLRAFGRGAHEQIRRSNIVIEDREPLLMLAVAAWSRAWVLDLLGEIVESLLARANGGEPRTEVKDIVTEYDNGVQMYMIAVAQGYDGDPWYRLAMLVAMAREGMTFFKSHGELLYGAAEESRPKAAELIEKQLRTFVDADLLNCFVETVVEADRDLQDPSRTRDRRLTGRLRRHPLASPRKLFAAVGILFELSARSGVTLTEEQWTALAGVLDRVGTPQMTLGALLDFQMSESGALSRSLRGGVPGLPYLKGRIKTIEQTMARPMLTTSERAVLSSWLWLLVTWYRPFVGDFCSLPQEQALWFLERLGSSAYRADTFWFARVRALPPPRFERPTEEHMGKVRFEDPEPSPDSPEALWGTFHVAREHLDLWGRYRMAEEGRRINPAVEFVFKQTLADPTEQVIAAPLDANPDDLERLTGVPRERWQRTDSAILIRQTPRTHSEMCALVDGARRVIGAVTRYLAGNGELPDDETIPDVDGASLRAALAANPARAVVFMGAYPGTPAPLLVFHARNGELVRHTIGALEGASPEEISVHGDALRSSFELTGALDDDRREPTALSWKNLGETLERVRISYAPWSRELAAVLAREALTDVLLVTRGITSALVPWEDMPADDSGATLGERFTISHTHTLAALPAPASAARAGAVQIYGDGRSREQMMPAASLMRSLSSVSVAREPLSGADACDGPALYEALRSASRLRFFLHGSHDRNRPHADRLTLIDGAGPQERVDLNPDNIRVLPLGGMRCVELWACEGAAYGRHLMEHGTAEEPEDLTTAFLHAGAQRVLAPRWHVPALPSALLMERVALLVHAGVDEARALADAQSELRAAFAPRGPVERDVVAAAAPLLRELGARGGSSIEGESRAILEEVLDEKIHELRVSWYDAASLEPPQGRIRWGEQRLGRLVRFVPPRSERLANALRETPDIWAAEATASFLAPLQSPACWAGWKVTLRSFDAWGA